MNKYLLEIGVEEFPAAYVRAMLNQLKDKFSKLLRDNKIKVDELKVESTPRRFAVLLEGLDQEEVVASKLVKGPSCKIAYKDEEPSKALKGFLASQGATEDDIIIKEYKEEPYIYVEVNLEQKSIPSILKENLPDLIRSLNSPKNMKWGGKDLKFARPIRYFLSLYNDEVLDFDLEGIKVSNITKGHRDLGSQHILVDSIDNYEKLLRENGVILKREDRKKIIKTDSIRLAKEKGGELNYSERLLNELVDINEYPTAFIGEFDSEYLSLPKEVIITVMVDHQRYFAVEDNDGSLMPYFIAIRNGGEEGLDEVVRGNEKVIEPRLNDAEFFYKEDLSKDLEEYIPILKTASYHEDLGSIYDKTERLVNLSDLVADQLAIGEEAKENVKRAAHLSKADLVTNMVVEFTELQGIMGRVYASKSGEKEAVAKAIEEQYMPRSSGESLPQSTAGTVLSISEKMDSIASMYAVGIRVTGSQDPFALRRAALGIIRMVLDKNLDLDLEDLVKDALYTVLDNQSLVFDYDEVKKAVMEFMMVRFRTMLIDDGYDYDLVDAVIRTGDSKLATLFDKVKILDDFLDENPDLVETVNRIENIIKDSDFKEVNEDLLDQEEEKVLYDQLARLDEVNTLIDRKDFNQALLAFNEFCPSLNNFFDQVMVNVDDESLRANRLALLKRYYDTIARIFIGEEIVKK